MSLTISQPPATKLGFSSTTSNIHDFASRTSIPPPRTSPTPRVDSPVTSLQASANPSESRMSTPHRGFPPPSGMALPEPTRPGLPSLTQSLGAMPAPPTQWSGQEDAMRNWLLAKAEEDKRKQEEEKTRQETLRLEQRKIEQAMLHDSLRGGIPPNLIPIIYVGMGGANLASLSMELIQQYSGQLQAAHQQIAYHASPDMQREGRLLGPGPGPGPAMYTLAQQQQPPPHPPQHAVLPSQPMEPPQPAGPIQTTFPVYQPGPTRATAAAPTSAPRGAAHAQLPRLTTNEASMHPLPQQVAGVPHPLQPSQAAPHDQATSSPSIYFHHWQPPVESKPTTSRENPSTPAGKGEAHHAHSSSLISESDYRESPRKRKAQGAHQPNPPPPATTSPSFSTGSSGSGRKAGHMRSRSNASTGLQDPDSRPGSSRHEGDSRPPPSSYAMPRRRSDEQRQSPLRRSTSRPREPLKRRLSIDSTQETHRERPGAR